MIPDDERCTQSVPNPNGEGFRPCSNRSKHGGVCGVHHRANQSGSTQAITEAKAGTLDQLERVGETLRKAGVRMDCEIVSGGVTGRVTVDGLDLEKLLDELERLRAVPRATVSGEHLPLSLNEFRGRCELHITEEQEKPAPDNYLIGLLCDGIRLARENEHMARRHLT